MPTLEKMVDGFKVYKATIHEKQKDLITHQEQAGIRPTTLVITSSDLHVSPDVITSCTPGDLYVIRMKAGLVPPYSTAELSGFTATLEYAIQYHKVQNILILGHSHNDGLEMVLDGGLETTDSDPLKAWLGIAGEVAQAVNAQMAEAPREHQERAMELETVVMNIRNLFTYPWIEKRINAGELEIYGWHFDVESGQLLAYMPTEGTFVPVD